MNDPRDILKAAGVECAAVDEWLQVPDVSIDDVSYHASAAILALTRLVAKYKWQRDQYETEIRRCYEALHAEFGNWPPDAADEFFADLDHRWEERHA